MTRARELAVAYPSLPGDAAAAEVARVLAEEPVDTLTEIAAAMTRAGSPLVAVRDEDGRLLGSITTSRLITRLLGAPQ